MPRHGAARPSRGEPTQRTTAHGASQPLSRHDRPAAARAAAAAGTRPATAAKVTRAREPDAGEVWDLPQSWRVLGVPVGLAQGVPHVPPLLPSADDWQTAGVDVRWNVAAADTQQWLALAAEVFEAGPFGVPQTVHQEAEFVSGLHARMREQSTLRGGQLARYERVWQAAHAAMGYPDHWRSVLEWIRGFPGIFCDPRADAKCAEPRHECRVRGVRAALMQEGLSRSEIDRMLQQPRPPAMSFANRFGSDEEESFARSEIAENIARGSVLRWPFAEHRPHVVLSLAIARNAEGKLRLILDARYVNLWLQYLPFSFETLTDLVQQGEQGAFMATWDLKAGYHHVPLAASLWPLLGFRMDGQFYVFCCLPFGLSQAPYVFTRVMQCAHEWTRSQHHRLTAMIDDAATVHESRHGAARAAGATVLLEAALGFVHSRAKCCLWPQQEQQFLGLLVDWQHAELRVPEKKLVRLRSMCERLQQHHCEKVLRSALGLLASCMPALKLTALLGRWVRLAGEGDRAVDAQDAAALTFLVENLGKLNGRPMRARAPVLELNADRALARQWPQDAGNELAVACDASETAYGAFVAGALEWRMVLDLSEAERAAQLSSTLRELRGFSAALRGLEAANRLSPGQAVQIWTDSQPAYACCVRMRGRGQVFAEVCSVHLLAWRTAIDLSFVWVPREHEALRAADELSKWVDGSDWRFSRTLAEQQIFDNMGCPDVDCLASAQAHMCKVYYSAMYDGQCAAVDGMAQPWNRWPRRASRAGQPLVWVFPPVALIIEVLLKIERETAQAIVVLPRKATAQADAILDRLPVTAERQLTGPHAVMVRPTSRVPRRYAAGGWKVPLRAVKIHWDG